MKEQLLFGYIDTGSFYAFLQLILATVVGVIVIFKNYNLSSILLVTGFIFALVGFLIIWYMKVL